MKRPLQFGQDAHIFPGEIGLKSLRWLCDIQTAPAGHFRPIGSNGFNVQGGHRSQFDQQPIEAHATLPACLEAYRATKDSAWSVEAQRDQKTALPSSDQRAQDCGRSQARMLGARPSRLARFRFGRLGLGAGNSFFWRDQSPLPIPSGTRGGYAAVCRAPETSPPQVQAQKYRNSKANSLPLGCWLSRIKN